MTVALYQFKNLYQFLYRYLYVVCTMLCVHSYILYQRMSDSIVFSSKISKFSSPNQTLSRSLSIDRRFQRCFCREEFRLKRIFERARTYAATQYIDPQQQQQQQQASRISTRSGRQKASYHVCCKRAHEAAVAVLIWTIHPARCWCLCFVSGEGATAPDFGLLPLSIVG